MEKKKVPLQARVCLFCNMNEDNELQYGKFYELDGDIVTHYYCLLLSSNMEQNGGDNDGILGFLRDDILKEWRRGKRLLCWYCKQLGATLSCCVPRCKKVFHLPCGRREGSLHQFFGQFKSFCSSHRPIQKIDPSVLREVTGREATCAICYESVEPRAGCSTLWAPCCRINAWFHRDCVQRLAMSAGYFFKCPLCNNKAMFQKAMLDFGIYIPEQDASWELVPNAYQELLHRHNRCDAGRCNCPKGRQHEMAGTRWELVLCRYCGSQGVHVGCGPLKWSNPEWECEECKTMLQNAQERRQSEGEDEEDEDEPFPADSAEDLANRHRHRVGPLNSRSQSMDSSSSSHSLDRKLTSGPVSPPTPITIVEVSDDDDDVIEIIDDDDDPPVKDSRSVLSADGVAIPVIQVSSIPVSSEGQDFCVVGDLNVRVPGQPSEVRQVQSARPPAPVRSSVVARPPPAPAMSNTTPYRPILPKVDLMEEGSANKRLKTEASTHTSQTNIAASGQANSAPMGGLLKSYLTEGMQREGQQTYNQPLVSTASVHASNRRSRNPNRVSRVRRRQQCPTGLGSPAGSTTTVPSSGSHDQPHKCRRCSTCTKRTSPSAEREPRHCDDRVIPSNVSLSDLRFRVLDHNTLQMVFYNRYIVTLDLQTPQLQRQARKVLNRPSTELQSHAMLLALSDDNVSSTTIETQTSVDATSESDGMDKEIINRESDGLESQSVNLEPAGLGRNEVDGLGMQIVNKEPDTQVINKESKQEPGCLCRQIVNKKSNVIDGQTDKKSDDLGRQTTNKEGLDVQAFSEEFRGSLPQDSNRQSEDLDNVGVRNESDGFDKHAVRKIRKRSRSAVKRKRSRNRSISRTRSSSVDHSRKKKATDDKKSDDLNMHVINKEPGCLCRQIVNKKSNVIDGQTDKKSDNLGRQTTNKEGLDVQDFSEEFRGSLSQDFNRQSEDLDNVGVRNESDGFDKHAARKIRKRSRSAVKRKRSRSRSISRTSRRSSSVDHSRKKRATSESSGSTRIRYSVERVAGWGTPMSTRSQTCLNLRHRKLFPITLFPTSVHVPRKLQATDNEKTSALGGGENVSDSKLPDIYVGETSSAEGASHCDGEMVVVTETQVNVGSTQMPALTQLEIGTVDRSCTELGIFKNGIAEVSKRCVIM